jgi:acyl-CoA thioesterase I
VTPRTILILALLLAACARPAPVPPHAIVALGDSLTEGHHLAPQESWPARLEAHLGRVVVNRGVSGETATQTLERLEREGLPAQADVVLVCVGANDILRGLPPAETLTALRAIVRRAQKARVSVVVIGLEGYRTPRQAFDYGAAYRKVTTDTASLYIPDLTRDTLGRPHLMRDAIHPNAAGNEVIARRLAEILRPWLRGQAG